MKGTSKVVKLEILAGPNAGIIIEIANGTCRLVGRRLTARETVKLDLEGHRQLDSNEVLAFDQHLGGTLASGDRQQLSAFQRGPDITLSDESVSCAHAMVFLDDGGPGVVDLASTNRTLVNDRAQSAVRLRPGDLVKFGTTVMKVGG